MRSGGLAIRVLFKPLTVALKDTAPSVRINALHALGKFGESAVAALISALADPVASVRRHAIAALEKTGSQSGYPPIGKDGKEMNLKPPSDRQPDAH